MLTDTETPHGDIFGHPLDHNDECEFCERSVVARFGGVPSYQCDSCRDDFKRELAQSGGLIEVVAE